MPSATDFLSAGMLANPMFYIKIGFVLAAVLIMRAIKSSVFGDPGFVSAGTVPARPPGASASWRPAALQPGQAESSAVSPAP